MDQAERRVYLINALLKEKASYHGIEIPVDDGAQKDLLRSLMNVREPAPASDVFLKVQDEYLKSAIAEKGVVTPQDLTSVEKDIFLWKGDITTLEVDAIVNAANSQMLGCFVPLHRCIDNCIHTYAGIQLRNCCDGIMKRQGHEEPTGRAKITPAFNLPSKYVLHTVGPIVGGKLTAKHCDELASCYTSCLSLADENGCESIAFCCISTGVFGFPQKEAAHIAVNTVREYKKRTGSKIKVVFNVFKDDDLMIYKSIFDNN